MSGKTAFAAPGCNQKPSETAADQLSSAGLSASLKGPREHGEHPILDLGRIGENTVPNTTDRMSELSVKSVIRRRCPEVSEVH